MDLIIIPVVEIFGIADSELSDPRTRHHRRRRPRRTPENKGADAIALAVAGLLRDHLGIHVAGGLLRRSVYLYSYDARSGFDTVADEWHSTWSYRPLRCHHLVHALALGVEKT